MLFTILVPEYIVGKALSELIANGSSKHRLEETKLLRGTDERWNKTKTYMANMGYFIVDFRKYWLEANNSNLNRLVEIQGSEGPDRGFATKLATPEYSLREEVQLLLKDDWRAESTQLNLSRLSQPYWALSARQLSLLAPIIDLPDVPVRQLEVLDRGDALVKALALVQIIYLIIQLVARKVGDLPSAQLEIAALAFSAASFITYSLYWNRPQGVESVHVIKPKCAPSRLRIGSIASAGPVFLWTKFRPLYKFEKVYDVEPIPNDGLLYIEYFTGAIGLNSEIVVFAGGAFLGGTIFGAVHCLAWNFHFPTPGEALTWRICSVMTSALPLFSALPLGIWMRWHPWDTKPQKLPAVRFALGLILVFGCLVPYILARLYLIAEMFRSLFFLPPEAFVDTWSGSFPHLG